jgi:galactose mutarotase-like enzyme
MNRATIQIGSPELSLRFEPELGGKWRSLRDLRSGREWFWRNPHLAVEPVRYADSFVEKMDTGGWDEILPSVDPTSEIPDHGDLVGLPWQVESAAADHLSMSVEGRCFPFRFRRAVTVSGAVIRIDYSLEHLGTEPFPWLWCAHPLLPLSPDLRLSAKGSFHVKSGFGMAGALVGRSINLGELPAFANQAFATKLFSEAGGTDEITASHADGTSLRMKWDAERMPFLALWINSGFWSGCGSPPYFNIGIEPTNCPADDLSAASNPPLLLPGTTEEWSLQLSIN